jgi:hypothetical protein
MTFSQFNAAMQRLASQYPIKSSVSVDVQSWTYFDDANTLGRTRITYGASWQANGYGCLVSGGNTPEDAIKSMAAQLTALLAITEGSEELAGVDVDSIPQVRGPA